MVNIGVRGNIRLVNCTAKMCLRACIEVLRGPYVNTNAISYKFPLCYIRLFVAPCVVVRSMCEWWKMLLLVSQRSAVWSMCEWWKMLLLVSQRSAVWCGLCVNGGKCCFLYRSVAPCGVVCV